MEDWTHGKMGKSVNEQNTGVYKVRLPACKKNTRLDSCRPLCPRSSAAISFCRSECRGSVQNSILTQTPMQLGVAHFKKGFDDDPEHRRLRSSLGVADAHEPSQRIVRM